METDIHWQPALPTTDPRADLRAHLAERTQRLHATAAALKTELFGIDDIIDQVIDSVRAWYVLPQLITRPVIVCLWGLTGTGKTQLVRRLAQHLGFYDRFVEVQMDGFSHGASRWSASTISGMLSQSGVVEGAPGVLVLDEFQRYRTKDADGNDVKVERYQDVWALLSDGRLPPALSLLGEIESSIASAAYNAEQNDDDEDDIAKAAKRKLKLAPWQAQEIKQNLKLREPLSEIMAWTPDAVLDRLRAFRDTQQRWETDYSQLLVFVCGNLDEMYDEMATRVEDCDTDADVFHAVTRKLSVIDVKKALATRFKPEQIARLGNNHAIYPSLSRATYEQLIRSTCARYVDEIFASSGVRFALDDGVHAQVYANGVFPAQGTRPLFSSIHAILSATLVNAALWALEHDVQADDTVRLSMADGAITAHLRGAHKPFAVPLALDRVKQRASEDFRALLAVHEAGHGLVYALLFGRAPQEIKINVASFAGGYNSFAPLKAWSRREMRDWICMVLAGRAAECLVFGDDLCTSGAEGDLRSATSAAARYVRRLGFGGRLSRTDTPYRPEEQTNTAVAGTNDAIEALLQAEMVRARALLERHRPALLAITDALLRDSTIAPEAFAQMVGVQVAGEEDLLAPYAQRLAGFRAGGTVAPNTAAPARVIRTPSRRRRPRSANSNRSPATARLGRLPD